MNEIYLSTINSKPLEFWNSVECIDDLRRLAKKMRRRGAEIVFGGDSTSNTTAGELADSLDRRATRLEKYGE
ncbi:MAG: hypothetical protein VX796_05945 [Pseudomonadota bacterium]|nr:hypothetical protein [Pseudomonadota bacterium]